jgi:hypothetical protein
MERAHVVPGVPVEKESSISQHEDLKRENAHQIAERGHVATDM